MAPATVAALVLLKGRSGDLVDAIEVEKGYSCVAGGRYCELFAETGSGIAGQDRVAGVVSGACEQITSPGQAFQMVVSHYLAPFDLTQGEDTSRFIRFRSG